MGSAAGKTKLNPGLPSSLESIPFNLGPQFLFPPKSLTWIASLAWYLVMGSKRFYPLVILLPGKRMEKRETRKGPLKAKGRHKHGFKEPDFEFIAPEEDYTAKPDISTANVPVSTTGAEVSTASPEVRIVAQSLVYIRRSASKKKDKGKAIMKEAEPVQKKTKLQLEQERLRLEEALRLQEQLDEEERQRIARVQEEASTFNDEEWDNIQAQIEADEELAHRLQAQERERYSEADKARLLVELTNERKRKFSQKRSEQRKNKPMNQAQQRTYMCNYIKHIRSHTLQQLKKLSFDEIKELFEITMKRVNTFTSMESDDTVPKVIAGSSKRDAKQELNQESSKSQKIGEGSEPTEESKENCLKNNYNN
ncbi:hypothetical protein Tco_0072391 [Tanacetum coccineum]